MPLLAGALAWLLRAVVVKFVVFAALAAIVLYAVGWITDNLVPQDAGQLSSLWGAMPAKVWWFVEYCRIPEGFAICWAALCSRFLLRRIPLLG